MLPTRLLVGLVAATVEAEGAEVEDRPRALCRTEARGDSTSVRGGSCGGECGMVIAPKYALLTPVRLKVVGATRARLAVLCVGWGETSCAVSASLLVGVGSARATPAKGPQVLPKLPCTTENGEERRGGRASALGVCASCHKSHAVQKSS